MQIQCINKSQYSYNFQKKNKVIEDGNYVKIPKEKYEQDKIKRNIIVAWLIFEIIRDIYKFIIEKPPKI